MLVRRSATYAAVTLLAACAGDGDGLDQNGRPVNGGAEPLQPELASIQSNVFTPICTTCHSGAAAPLGLRLDEGASFAMLVNAPSVEVPALNRVTPGDPDASYLIQKIEGTASVGGRMPLGGPALPQETIAVIRQWIANGAQESVVVSASATETKAAKIETLWPLADFVSRESPRDIVLRSDATLDTTLLTAGTVTLRRSGGDGEFSDDDAVVVDASITVRSMEPTVIVLAAPADQWVADQYELRISAGSPLALADLAARPIDGDGDGVPGGDFVLRFAVEDGQ